jgi:tetratricopeptide (TPR) repeat protein
MRAKTIKRLAILIAVLSLVGGTGFFTQQYQVTKLAHTVADRAAQAEKEGDFAKAEELYRQHLVVVPDDVEIQLKYAGALRKGAKSPKRQDQALRIYGNILRRNQSRVDVRRLQMTLNMEMLRFVGDNGAEGDLKILLDPWERLSEAEREKTSPDDADLMFMRGQCSEAGNNDEDAQIWYQRAIKYHAPRSVETYQRLATLLRDRLKQPEEAERTIENMVKSDPENYHVYLARGRYRLSTPNKSQRESLLAAAKVDFQKALKQAPNEPDVYLELANAELAGGEAGARAARNVLEDGLKQVPASVALYEALARLQLGTGHADQAVATLEGGLNSAAEKTGLRFMLANVLAQRGDTGKLLLQIEELRKVGLSPFLLDILSAHYHINSKEFRKARQLLVPVDLKAALHPHFKAQVCNLLALCYGQLGEPEMEQDARARALRANPQDNTARRGVIENMVKQGQIEGAIKEYRELIKLMPQVRPRLLELLTRLNRQRPASQRDWNEVDTLIDAWAKESPESVDPVILRANSYLEQNLVSKAQEELEKAQARFPQNVTIWGARANLKMIQKQFGEAQALLDQAQKQLGDRVELRLQRARLAATKGGPQVVKDLNDLGQNIESFSKEDRRALLNGLALELLGQGDIQGTIRLWSRVAEQEPNNVDVRIKLLDLAFQAADREAIDRNIKEIEQIEGNEGLVGRYCQARYVIWQAQRASGKDPQETLRLRTKARVLLSELMSRRPNWSVIPLALADLDEQELAQGGLNDDEIRAKEDNIIRSYRRAIGLGQRGSAVVRRTVQLLFKNKRGGEAVDLLNDIPLESQAAGGLGRQVEQLAIENQDFQLAVEHARRAVDANPTDFQARGWLAQILLRSGNQDGAEAEFRKGLDLSKSDPDRWIALIQLLVLTKKLDKAAQAIAEAEATLPPAKAPLVLAQCYEMLGRAYEGNDEAKEKASYAEARKWYVNAQTAQPDNLTCARQLTDFYVRTRQITEAEAQLAAIRKRGTGPNNAEMVAWATRTLALIGASSTDPKRVRDALSLFGPDGHAAVDPDDLRVLARVLEAQKTVGDRKRAIGILQSLVDKKLANVEDHFLLARLYEISGDWLKARERYRALDAGAKTSRDLETLNRRPLYLAKFATDLLRHRQAGGEQEVNEAQDVVNELKLLQPDALGTLLLQVDVDLARNQIDKAVAEIRACADQPNVDPLALRRLAEVAEKPLGRFEFAEELYRRLTDRSTNPQAKLPLAMFLGRRGRVKEALDICEPLWANERELEAVAARCIEVVSASNKDDPSQVDRVAGWLDKALSALAAAPAQNLKAVRFLTVALGNLRERQRRYQDAETLYRRAIEKGDPDAISYNNLAWLLALNDRKGEAALEYINKAIALKGLLPEFLDTRGVIYLIMGGKTQLAIDDLEKVVAADPSASKLFHLAQAYNQANNKEKAKGYFKQAKVKGLPTGLHPLEKLAYQKLPGELGLP